MQSGPEHSKPRRDRTLINAFITVSIWRCLKAAPGLIRSNAFADALTGALFFRNLLAGALFFRNCFAILLLQHARGRREDHHSRCQVQIHASRLAITTNISGAAAFPQHHRYP
jgi:hypothetical protein